jgi:release factor glutamine methyltransferase
LRAAGCVFAEDEARVLRESAPDAETLEAWTAARVAGRPLEHLVGWVEFCGLRLRVDAGVFVPRQRSALLVEEAAARLRPGQTVLDLCCGCAALGAAVAHRVPGLGLYAADIDEAARASATANIGDERRVFIGDLFDAVPSRLRGSLNAIVVNAPYVPTDAIALMPPEAREHEARWALDGGSDGLDVHRRVAAEAAGWLAPGGWVLIETSSRQLQSSERIFAENGFAVASVHDSERDATVVCARTADPGATPGASAPGTVTVAE